MATQIETAEQEIFLVKHAPIRPMMIPTSSNPWRTGGSRTRSWTCSYSSTRQSYRSPPGGRGALIRSPFVDRPQQEV